MPLGLLEALRTSDRLMFPEQPCGSGLDLEPGDSAGSLCERRSQKLHNV
jgi:hypothetical protein